MRRIVQSAIPVLFALCLAACAAPLPDAGVSAPPMSDPLPATPVPAQPARPAVAGVPDLDRSCRVDSDCAVKNVGNCCGYFPACVNTDAQPDPAAVQAACAQSGMVGVCGFKEIEACACVASTCEPASSAGALR
ncbi:hypothetical protein GCM10011394_07010 [Luteimonas terricola]|uniref:Secreted protein n=1 Tax=Luteimonas terricola TaxID=645597 RepID=A0ABQ2E837_9GAMM|nr:hypothetical protein GCM10011394_07010 [Luteimonas terricola]